QSLAIPTGNPETMDQAAALLFGIMAVGDDRNVDETWIAGKCAYRKADRAQANTRPVPLDLLAATPVAAGVPH
ncbi:MAG: hypothetical protein K8T25_12220, partial [Planctomycetia bacterium]|nr:hypothetical protein [Planctomycetia bacterium]